MSIYFDIKLVEVHEGFGTDEVFEDEIATFSLGNSRVLRLFLPSLDEPCGSELRNVDTVVCWLTGANEKCREERNYDCEHWSNVYNFLKFYKSSTVQVSWG